MRTQQRAIWNTAAAAEVATTAAPSQSILHIFGGVVQYMHDDPHCDNLEDIFGDLPVTAMLVPLKRKTIEAKVQEGSWDFDGEHGCDFSVKMTVAVYPNFLQ